MKKKKILVISPDACPFKARNSELEKLSKEDREVFSSKVLNANSLGERAYNTATQLGKVFDVTLAVPHYNFFNEKCIDLTTENFEAIPYNYDLALKGFSEELQEVIEKHDVVINQTSAVGFANCIKTSEKIKIIADGWIPLGVERATSIGCLDVPNQDKNSMWTGFKETYFAFLDRADIILFSNLSQKYYYIGILNSIDSINFKNFQHSKLLKINISVNNHEPLPITYRKEAGFNLVWFGAAYPWYNPFILVEAFEYLKKENINLTFVGIEHPRFKRLTNDSLLEKIKDKNINIIPEYTPLAELKNFNFHLSVILAYNLLEKQLAHRYRSLQIASYGLPICTNFQDNVGMILQKYGLCYPVLTYTPKKLADSIKEIRDNYKPPAYSSVKNYQNSLAHKKSFEPLIGYLKEDAKWRLI